MDGKDISGKSCGGEAEGLGQTPPFSLPPPKKQTIGKTAQIPPILLASTTRS